MGMFEKKELQMIYDGLIKLKYHETSYIMKKIKGIIDNYCEHKNSYILEFGEHQTNYCQDCKETFE